MVYWFFSMWAEILCGLIVYKLVRRLFSVDVLEVETSDGDAILNVANRLQKLYGGKSYVGLRIPNPDTGLPLSIDVVFTSREETVVVSVKNFSGFVSVRADGNWICEGDGRHKTELQIDPVEEVKKQTLVLQLYLEQRGISLPKGYISHRVILPNPKFCTLHSNYFPDEVITYDQWVKLKPQPKMIVSAWIKHTFPGGRKAMLDPVYQQLEFVLSTAPIWDRLELKGGKHIFGEFIDFKGKHEDILALRNIKRSKVSHLAIQKTSMLGLAPSRLQVLYYLRDYRREASSEKEYKEVTVASSTEIHFIPSGSPKARKFKLSSIISLLLDA